MLLAKNYRVMVHSDRVALGYRLTRMFFRALQTSLVHHNSTVHAKA